MNLHKGVFGLARRALGGIALLGCLLACAGVCAAAETPKPAALAVELTPDWTVKQTPADKGVKGNVYRGELGLRNAGAAAAEKVAVRVAIFGANGAQLSEPLTLEAGTIEPGKTAVRPFVLMPGVPFAELRVSVDAVVGGVPAQAEFSSFDGTRPVSHAASPNGLPVLSRTLTKKQKLSARKADPVTVLVSMRVKNANPAEAKELGLRAVFMTPKGEKKIDLTLPGGAIKPGEIRRYDEVKLEGVPSDYTDCKLEVVGEVAGASVADAGAAVPGEGLQVRALKIEGAREVVTFSLTSYDFDVPAGKVELQLRLIDRAGKEVKVLRQALPQAFPKGQPVSVEVSTAGTPDFVSCEAGVVAEVEVDEPDAK